MRLLFTGIFPLVLTLGLTLAGGQPLRAQEDAASRRAAIEGMYPVMINALESKNFGRARNICDQAIIWEPQNPVHHYNLACIEAQAGGGRLPYAFGELELSIALGFNDVDHLKADPDLAPMRGDPKFNLLVQKAANSALGLAAAAVPSSTSKKFETSEPATAIAVPDRPAATSFQAGLPTGLYFMTRYWTFTRRLEEAAWYFAADGVVCQNLARGFSADELAAHAGPKGTARLSGNELEIAWADGKKSIGAIERERTGFIWDRGIFTAARAFDNPADVVGFYESVEPLSSGADTTVARRLELHADHTFRWLGAAFAAATSQSRPLSHATEEASTGRWQLSGYSLILTDAGGTVRRQIVFPCDDGKKPPQAARMYLGGEMYKKL